eukprot:8970222-Prorocentrum_lima.AAC.1
MDLNTAHHSRRPSNNTTKDTQLTPRDTKAGWNMCGLTNTGQNRKHHDTRKYTPPQATSYRRNE